MDTDTNPAWLSMDSSFMDSDNKLLYGVRNDAQNLYFSFRVINDATQMKILRGGMTLWLDSTGNKNERTGIKFPLGFRGRKENNQEQETENSSSEQNTGGYRNQLKQQDRKTRLKEAVKN